MSTHEAIPDLVETYNLKRLFVFRTSVLMSEMLVIGLAIFTLGVDLPLQNMFAVIAIYAVFNILVWARLKKGVSATANEFFFHLVIDVVALAALLYFSGGSSNPFVSLFLLPLVIVATTLPKRYVWLMAVVTLVCYSLLMLMNVPLSQEMAQGQGMSRTMHHEMGHGMAHEMPGHQHHAQADGASSNFGLHVLGMWFSFVLGVGVILFFVVSMAEGLRQRDKKLAESREKHLRDEHVVALGTLAAGAAHELGTPLATMAVLTKEMELEYADDPELVEKVEILRSQVDRCKTTIGQISASAGQQKADSGHKEDVKSYIQHSIQYWQGMHPNTDIKVRLDGSEPAPVIVLDATLNQAMINVLNNAAEASPEKIELDANWTSDELTLEIRDYGEGLSQTVLASLGTPFFTTKENGQGLGFYLTQAVVHRLGGEVSFANHAQGGACITLKLPLLKLKVG